MVAKVAIMKRFLILFCMVFLCQSCLATPVVVKYIVDGDTFVGDVLMDKGTQVKSVSIRLINVDTPEIHGQCDEEIRRAEYAKQRLEELIPIGSTVEIRNVKNDKYPGRALKKAPRVNSAGRFFAFHKIGRLRAGLRPF